MGGIQYVTNYLADFALDSLTTINNFLHIKKITFNPEGSIKKKQLRFAILHRTDRLQIHRMKYIKSRLVVNNIFGHILNINILGASSPSSRILGRSF